MILDKYLVIKGKKQGFRGYSATVRIVERVPTLQGNEFSLRLRLDIPDAIFERPQLSAELAVPSTSVQEIKITPDVTKKIESIIKESTGLTMNVSVIEHPKEEKK